MKQKIKEQKKAVEMTKLASNFRTIKFLQNCLIFWEYECLQKFLECQNTAGQEFVEKTS